MSKIDIVMRCYFLALCLCLPTLAMAKEGAIVKCVQPDGSVTYTNKKCKSGRTEKINKNVGRLPAAAVTAEFAFVAQESNVDVRGEGEVIKILADDKAGGRHQRFIVKLDSGHTLLIAHNIDLAPRIDNLRLGDTVQFYGEYLWSERGGLLHRTHHDPQGRRADGWLVHNGKRYQ